MELPCIHTEHVWKWYLAGWIYHTSLCTPHCILHYIWKHCFHGSFSRGNVLCLEILVGKMFNVFELQVYKIGFFMCSVVLQGEYRGTSLKPQECHHPGCWAWWRTQRVPGQLCGGGVGDFQNHGLLRWPKRFSVHQFCLSFKLNKAQKPKKWKDLKIF